MNNASNTIYRATLSKSAAYTPKLLGIFFFLKLILNNLFIQWQKETGDVMGKLVRLIKTSGKVTWFIDILVKLSPNIPGCFLWFANPITIAIEVQI